MCDGNECRRGDGKSQLKEEEVSVAVAQVRKRDGRIVPFDRERITNAIFKAAQAVGQDDGRRVAARIT